jgi:hypothetical protein
MKFVAVTGKDATPALFDIWDEQLRDIAPDKIAIACDRLMKTWRYPNLPQPGDVRAQLDDAAEKGFELESEREWQRLLSWVREYVFPDTGIRRGTPRLAPAVEHAAKAAGGIFFIERCAEDQLVWCRKTFFASYKNVHETGRVRSLLGRSEAKNILAQLAAGPPSPKKKQLAPVPEPSVPLPPREEVRKVLNRVAELPSEEDWEARKLDQKARALQWAKDHGLEIQSTSP